MGKLKDALSGMFNPLGKKPETRKENAAELKPETRPVPREEPVAPQPETPPAPLKEPEKPQPATTAGPVAVPAEPVAVPAEPAVSLGNFKDKADVEETIGDCLVRQMSKFIGGTGYPDLTIWIDDPIAVQLATKEFQDYLKKLLLHNGCRPQSPKTVLTVRAGAPDGDVIADILSKRGKLNPGKVFLSIRQEVEAAAEKAVLVVYRRKGSLCRNSYVIDPSVKSRYRIGRGETSSRPEYSFRSNDIIINTADEDKKTQALNNRVSSAHADLVCRDGRFFLQVLPPGCAVGGNSTRIIRDQKPIELDQPSLSYPLFDGDLIELGGAVLLEFKLKH